MSDAVETGAGALTTGLTSAGTSALGGSAMAGIGTAMPYVGAGLLAGKALGLFNQGGQVGPLSAQYHAEGTYKKENDATNLLMKAIQTQNKYLDEKALGSARQPEYKAQGSMTEADAMALMNNQPNPDELYNEIMTEAAIKEIPQPMMRPPLMRVDPYGADTTSSPYDMIRPDNAPNT